MHSVLKRSLRSRPTARYQGIRRIRGFRKNRARQMPRTTSLLRDIYLGAERPWDVQPTTEPEVPEDIEQAIQGLVAAEIAQCRNQLQQMQAAQAQQAAAMQQAAMQGPPPGAAPAAPGSPGSAPPMSPPGPPPPTGVPQPLPGAGWSGPLAPESPAGPPGQSPQMPTQDQIEDRVAQLREAAKKAAKKKAVGGWPSCRRDRRSLDRRQFRWSIRRIPDRPADFPVCLHQGADGADVFGK